MIPAFLAKILGAKKTTLIRGGKLWEVTTLYGKVISEVEQAPVEAPAFQRPEAMDVGDMHVHVILPENNVTNLTKNAELL